MLGERLHRLMVMKFAGRHNSWPGFTLYLQLFLGSRSGTTYSLDRCGHVRVGGKRLWTARVDGELTQSLRHRNLMSPGHLWQAMRGTPTAVAQPDTRRHSVSPPALCQLR